jgi:hypothetical protein
MPVQAPPWEQGAARLRAGKTLARPAWPPPHEGSTHSGALARGDTPGCNQPSSRRQVMLQHMPVRRRSTGQGRGCRRPATQSSRTAHQSASGRLCLQLLAGRKPYSHSHKSHTQLWPAAEAACWPRPGRGMYSRARPPAPATAGPARAPRVLGAWQLGSCAGALGGASRRAVRHLGTGAAAPPVQPQKHHLHLGWDMYTDAVYGRLWQDPAAHRTSSSPHSPAPTPPGHASCFKLI